jgi:hypothetical protein
MIGLIYFNTHGAFTISVSTILTFLDIFIRLLHSSIIEKTCWSFIQENFLTRLKNNALLMNITKPKLHIPKIHINEMAVSAYPLKLCDLYSASSNDIDVSSSILEVFPSLNRGEEAVLFSILFSVDA